MSFIGAIIAVLIIGLLVSISLASLWPQIRDQIPAHWRPAVVIVCIVVLTLIIVGLVPGEAARAFPTIGR